MEKKRNVRGGEYMGFINKLKRWWNNDMSTTNNKDFFHSAEIERYYKLYNNHPEWVNNDTVYGLGLGKSIVKEVTKTALTEFEYEIKTKNRDLLNTYNFINKEKRTILNHLQVGGKVAIKPFIYDENVLLAIVKALDFKEEYDNIGRLEIVYFKTDIKEGYSEYRLIEKHIQDYNTNTYRIENKLEKKNGEAVALKTLPQFENLDDFIVIEDITKHLSSILTIGDSIYADVYELIEQADRQYSRLLWEYEGGELAINANADLFSKSGSSLKNQYELPKGKGRLYRALETDNHEFTIDTYAPELRDESYLRGLNSLKREIEFACGLAYGTLSEPQQIEKSATEIVASKQRYYVTVSDIRKVFIDGIEDILQNVAQLSARIAPNEKLIYTDYEIIYDIGDSILTTSKEKLEEKIMLFKEGLITKEEFNEWYNS